MARLLRDDQAGRHETGFKKSQHTDEPKHRSGCASSGILKTRHFDLTHRGRAIVGEHVYPIVLSNREIDGSGLAGKRNAAHMVELPDVATDTVLRTRAERDPARGFHGI